MPEASDTTADTEDTVASAYSDLNGNTEVNDDDRHGLIFYGFNNYMGFIEACGIDFIERDGDEYSWIMENAHNVDIIERLCRFVWKNDGVYNPKLRASDSQGETVNETPFRSGNVLMSAGWLRHAGNMTRNRNIKPQPRPIIRFSASP